MALVETLGIIAGAGSTVFGAWVKVVKPYMKRLKGKKNEYYEKLNEIHSELRFNGGSSIKDAIFELKNTTKNIEFRLDGIEENQKLSMNLQGIAYWVSDNSGNCTYASPSLCKLMGRSESEILGSNWMAWVHPEEKDKIVDAWHFSVENKTPFDEIYTIKKPGGSWVKVWGVAFHKSPKNAIFGGTLGKLVPIEEPVEN